MATRTRRVEVFRDGEIIETREETYEVPAAEENLDGLQARIRQVMQTNRGYLAVASPTAAQNTAQIKALTRQVQALSRLLLDELDGTD